MINKLVQCYKEHPLLTIIFSVALTLLMAVVLYYLGYMVGKFLFHVTH